MTNRRRLLSTVGVSTIATIAGCLDEISNNGEDEPSSANNFESPSSNTDGGGSGDSNQNGGETGQTDESGVKNRETRREVVETYDDGVSDRNDGMSLRNRGVSNWNDDNYDTAISNFEGARDSFRDAKSHFSSAIDLTYEIDHPEAREICETGSEEMVLLADAMSESVRMARAGKQGDAERANNTLDKVTELEREAERLNPRNAGALETVLDID